MKIPAVLFSFLALVSCSPSKLAAPAPPGSVDHVVLVWLKHPGNEEEKAQLSAASEELRSIPGTRFFDKGVALKSANPRADASFDFAIVSRFDSAAALDAYQKHPLHQKKVNEVLKPLSKRIVVYDVTR